MGVKENITILRKEIPDTVKIVAVSKAMPVSLMMEAYNAGQRAFGENKVQEILSKVPQMPEDTEWHLIGHLQTNKVKSIVPVVHLIHSVDSLKLLAEINKESAKLNRVTNCLLQIRIAREETKFGLSRDEAKTLLASGQYREMKNVRIKGLMGMATFTEDECQIKSEFLDLFNFYNALKIALFKHDPAFSERSMGMSGDYKIALETGSTMVRIGSIIFGERNYNQ